MPAIFNHIAKALFYPLPLFLALSACTADDHPPAKAPKVNAEKTEAHARQAQYTVLLASRQFDALEAEAATMLNQHKAGKTSSDTLLTHLEWMVPPAGKALLPNAQEWVKAKPESYAARFVLGALYSNIGTEARGHGLAKDTSEQQFADMRQLLGQAQEVLQQSLSLYEKPYPSYYYQVNVAGLMGDHSVAAEALLASAHADPDAVTIYRQYMEFLSPRWGGSYEMLEALVKSAAKTGMSPQHVSILAAEVPAWRARDKAAFEQDYAGAVDDWIEAYETVLGKKQVASLYSAAYCAVKAKQIDRAIEIYTRIITEYPEEHEAYFKRGDLYHTEKKDYKRAFADMLASANQGNMSAQNNVGFYYMTGMAGTKDLDLAKKYLHLSADQGFEHAKEKLKLLENQ